MSFVFKNHLGMVGSAGGGGSVANISPRLDAFNHTNIYTVTGIAKENIAINRTGDVLILENSL